MIFDYKDKNEMRNAVSNIGTIRVKFQFLLFGYFLRQIRKISPHR